MNTNEMSNLSYGRTIICFLYHDYCQESKDLDLNAISFHQQTNIKPFSQDLNAANNLYPHYVKCSNAEKTPNHHKDYLFSMCTILK